MFLGPPRHRAPGDPSRKKTPPPPPARCQGFIRFFRLGVSPVFSGEPWGRPSDNLYMPDHAECPNCRRLLAEVRTLRRDLAAARNGLAVAKQRTQALEAELRRSKRQAAPFSRDTPTARPKRPGRKKGQGPFRHLPPPEHAM